jgi:hypothetical protein
MKTLKKDELYQNLQEFLKAKGVELKEGSYAQKIQKSCGLLSDAINTSQEGLSRAKVEIDKKLDQLRQVIHEKTAPATGPTGASQTQATPPPSDEAPKQPTGGKASTKKRATRKASKQGKPSA